jgi:tetrahydromethanopterin S-methyltransferase subunit E
MNLVDMPLFTISNMTTIIISLTVVWGTTVAAIASSLCTSTYTTQNSYYNKYHEGLSEPAIEYSPIL